MSKPIHLIAGEYREFTPQEMFPGVEFPASVPLCGTITVDAEGKTATVNVVSGNRPTPTETMYVYPVKVWTEGEDD